MGRSLGWQVGGYRGAGSLHCSTAVLSIWGSEPVTCAWKALCSERRRISLPSSEAVRAVPPCASGLFLSPFLTSLHPCLMVPDNRVDFYSYEMRAIMSATQDLWKDWRACKLRFCSWEHTVVTARVFLSASGLSPVHTGS